MMMRDSRRVCWCEVVMGCVRYSVAFMSLLAHSGMLESAIELALVDPIFEDMASKFFEHFVSICHAINHYEGTGLWDEEDGFFYDRLHMNGDDRILANLP
jgi:hypothetical protein